VAKITPLNKELHLNLTIDRSKNYAHAKGEHILPVVVHEFAALCTEYPIVYVKNADTGQFQAVAVVGFEPGENLFCGDDVWHGSYVPSCLQSYPLRFVNDQNDEKNLLIAIDEESDLVREGGENRLFDEKGVETEYLNNRAGNMMRHLESSEITKGFVNQLSKLELLVQKNLSVEIDGKPLTIGGIYTVDEKKLNELDAETFEDLRKHGFVAPIYAQMISVNQVPKLAKLKIDRSK
jgi:hypothetical protein